MSLRFHEIAESRHRILNPLTDDKLRLLGEICGFTPGTRILDLACGKGELLSRWAHDYAIEGVGVDPTNPPLAWEAWDGDSWEPCELDSDTTGGLNRDGDVVIHVPRGHTASLIAKQRAGWIRARVTEPVEGQPAYSASPNIKGLTVITIGGTAEAVNAEVVRDEDLGEDRGGPGDA